MADSSASSGRGPLALSDVLDTRAYERERAAFRAEVMALKRLRRVAIGPLVTVVFENRTTMRFQIQEMARAERMTTDDQIQAELDVYNPLIPGPGELSLTMFIELTSEGELREWLPKLVGVERALELRLGEAAAGATPEIVPVVVDPAHEAQLTREEVTASVHYVRFALDAGQQGRFVEGPASLVLDHPAYRHEAALSEATRRSLASDW
ncbi:MAG TPA: DUF3501 family protein [Acidimicrobiales bacterium]|nr:DUF3501 family protein [Acidimicrobiales bacterium]